MELDEIKKFMYRTITISSTHSPQNGRQFFTNVYPGKGTNIQNWWRTAKIQQQNINNICQATRGPVKRTFLKRNPRATNHHLWLLLSAPELQRATCGKNENTTCFVNLSCFQLYCESIIVQQKLSKPNLTHPYPWRHIHALSCGFFCVYNMQWAWPVLANSTVLIQQQEGFLL